MRPSLSLYRGRTSHNIITPPIVRISGATFYLRDPKSIQPGAANPGHFPNLNLELPSNPRRKQNWALICQKSDLRNVFFNILRGYHHADPESARSYPFLHTENVALRNPKLNSPANALQLVSFVPTAAGSGSYGICGSYIGERFEGLGRKTGISLTDYLTGSIGLDVAEETSDTAGKKRLRDVLQSLELDNLGDLPLKTLSNGQFRRARIAKALLQDSEFILLDSPFGMQRPSVIYMYV